MGETVYVCLQNDENSTETQRVIDKELFDGWLGGTDCFLFACNYCLEHTKYPSYSRPGLLPHGIILFELIIIESSRFSLSRTDISYVVTKLWQTVLQLSNRRLTCGQK